MKQKWLKIGLSVVKYALAAVLGGLGLSAVEGCAPTVWAFV